MGDSKGYREPRRRGFDDDFAPPRDRGREPPRPSRPVSSGPTVDATVKWFNPDKGFGFVETSDGADAFLHVSALEQAGHTSVPEGARMKVRTAPGQKGPQVTEVLEVDLSSARAPSAPRSSFGGGRPQSGYGGGARSQPMDEGGEEQQGTVKWFDPVKGFGFISLDSGGKDLFVHVTALERSGLRELAEGQRVIARVGQGPKGPEARSLRIA